MRMGLKIKNLLLEGDESCFIFLKQKRQERNSLTSLCEAITASCYTNNCAMPWKSTSGLHTSRSLIRPMSCNHKTSVTPGDPHSKHPTSRVQESQVICAKESSFCNCVCMRACACVPLALCKNKKTVFSCCLLQTRLSGPSLKGRQPNWEDRTNNPVD